MYRDSIASGRKETPGWRSRIAAERELLRRRETSGTEGSSKRKTDNATLGNREVATHRLPMWFEFPHHPEFIEGRSSPPRPSSG